VKDKVYKEGVTYIVRSNEDEPLKIGVYLGSVPISQAGTLVPVLLIDGKEMIVCSPMAEYTDSLWNELSALTRKEQWDHVCKLHKEIPFK